MSLKSEGISIDYEGPRKGEKRSQLFYKKI